MEVGGGGGGGGGGGRTAELHLGGRGGGESRPKDLLSKTPLGPKTTEAEEEMEEVISRAWSEILQQERGEEGQRMPGVSCMQQRRPGITEDTILQCRISFEKAAEQQVCVLPLLFNSHC